MHPMFKELFIDADDPGGRGWSAAPRAPVPASPAGRDHQARRRRPPGDPASAVTGDPPPAG
jgi:hypothetical protein